MASWNSKPRNYKNNFRKKEKDILKKIILSDLSDLKKRLAPISFRVYKKYGKLDEEKLDWIKNNSGIDFLKGIIELSIKGINQQQILQYLNKEGLMENKLTYFKKMHLFVTDSNLTNLGILDNHLVEKILEIRFHIEAFNEDVDNFREQLKMTFQSGVSNVNHKIITEALDIISLEIAEKSVYIVNKLNDILK